MTQTIRKHPVGNYKISNVTGARLPSINVLHSRISELERRLAVARSQLLEHTLKVEA